MRRKKAPKRVRKADPVYENVTVSRFINYLMSGGRKTAAEKVFYIALENIERNLKLNPLEVFEKALENSSPQVEVASRRVGGANYQVPREVRPERKFMLASRWIIEAARAKKGKSMAQKLAEELMAAYKNEGTAIKKKQDIHRMAEANRAFAHFAR
ncbi:MAG TPA: 30S ribosomal protein S7 [Candidatus Tyrphobacter sp.]|nr:30S ribosomal protein S7 [Candidatus Tyrphobacter sp.]